MFYRAEYIWIDGAQPTSRLRSKTKVIEKRLTKDLYDTLVAYIERL